MTGRRLRVGLVCPYSFDTPGGVQGHVLGLARFLADQGHEPHILAPGEPGDLPSAGSFTSAGAAVAVPYNGSVARVNFGPLSAARVRRWLRSGDFDVVHLHEPITPSISLLALLLMAVDTPVVATFHTATPRSRSMQLAGGALQAAIEKIDAGIAVSQFARQVVVQYLRRDAIVVPNGISYCHFATRAGDGIRPRATGVGQRWRNGAAPRLTFLGRGDEPRKGLEVLSRALPAITAQFPELDVVVAGSSTAARLPAPSRSLGVIGDREKATLLQGTDVFVAPHLARESFGIVLLEAMASKAPVVASNLPPFCDLLTPPSSEPLGTVVPLGDPGALARGVVSVLARPDHARLDRAQAAARRYDWSIVGAEVLEVYRAVGAAEAVPRRFAR